MTTYDYLRFFAALVFVLCLMGGLSYVVKRLNLGQGAMLSPAKKRLKIVEVLHLDGRHKAMLIGRDDTEHLVILNASGDTIVETNIQAAVVKMTAKTATKKTTTTKKEKNNNEKTNA